MKQILIAFVLAVLVLQCQRSQRLSAPQPPDSRTVASGQWHMGRYQLQVRDPDFALSGRVLGAEPYHLGREADLSPMDIALGWGPMADPVQTGKLKLSQGNRFLHWYYGPGTLPESEIIPHAANIHIIPANAQIRRALDLVTPGENLRLSGKLVDIEANDGWRWHTSLSRTDTGMGACEILWLERIDTGVQVPLH